MSASPYCTANGAAGLISFPRACRVRRRWRGAGMLLDGGRSWPERGDVLRKGSKDGGADPGAEPGAQRRRGSASWGWGCCWGQTACSAAARPAPRRAELWGWSSGLGVTEAPSCQPRPWRGRPRAGPRCGSTGTRGCGGCRAALVLLRPGLLGEPVSRAVLRELSPSRPGRCPRCAPAGPGPRPLTGRAVPLPVLRRGLGPRRCLLTCEGVGPTLSLRFNSPRALLSRFWGCESDKSL